MKKFTFITLMALSFNSLIAQTDFGVSASNNSWVNIPTGETTLNSSVSFVGPQIGAFGSVSLGERFALKSEIQYSFLKSNKVSNKQDVWIGEEHFFESNYHQFRMPVNLVMNLNKLTPSIGLFISHSVAIKNLVDNKRAMHIDGKIDDQYSLRLNQIGGNFSLGYKISNKLALNASYYMGLNGTILKFKHKSGNLSDVNTTGIEPKSHQLNVGISYTFNKNK